MLQQNVSYKGLVASFSLKLFLHILLDGKKLTPHRYHQRNSAKKKIYSTGEIDFMVELLFYILPQQKITFSLTLLYNLPRK